MRTKWLLRISLFFLALTLVLFGGKIGELDLFVQSSQAQTSSSRADLINESNPIIAKYLFNKPVTLYDPVAPSGAMGANMAWEKGQSNLWYIEEQRYGEDRILGGVIKNDLAAIESGFKIFDWGFARQAADGSFPGTQDDFHSTSFFIQSVARSMLFIQQSPLASRYRDRIARYKPLVQRAARWMITPTVWTTGLKRNLIFTHRRYLVADALGFSGKLTGDSTLLAYSRKSIDDGLALQRADGVNPERGGHDSSYQMLGIVYAERWVSHFPNDGLTPKVVNMINKGLSWEKRMILPNGEIGTAGNTRTGPGGEIDRSGKYKAVSHRSVLRGFSYWGNATGNKQWSDMANKLVSFYYP
jgi:hypothetical protein